MSGNIVISAIGKKNFKRAEMLDIDFLVHTLLTKVPDLQTIYLFGSIQTPYANSQSDIDVAFLAKTLIKPVMRWQLAQDLAFHFRRDVDLIDLKEASTVLRFEVVAHGKRIYCANQKECDLYETMVYSAYVRFNDERRSILEDISKRGQIHG